jgi:hypothetical protein
MGEGVSEERKEKSNGGLEGQWTHLSLVVTSGLLGRLGEESLSLNARVVQLRVRVAVLVVVDEQLEALREARARPVVLRQRRHQLGMVADERRAANRGRQQASK